MTGFGVRYRGANGRESTVEVLLKTDAEYRIGESVKFSFSAVQ